MSAMRPEATAGPMLRQLIPEMNPEFNSGGSSASPSPSWAASAPGPLRAQKLAIPAKRRAETREMTP